MRDSRRLQKLTQRGNKMFVGTQGFHATLVFVVPDPQSLVIGTAHNEFSTRVEEHPAHPVIMANLYKATNHAKHKHLAVAHQKSLRNKNRFKALNKSAFDSLNCYTAKQAV